MITVITYNFFYACPKLILFVSNEFTPANFRVIIK